MIRNHGMEPNVELLVQIAGATAKAQAEPYTRPDKPAKPPKPPKAPSPPKMVKPPTLPRIPRQRPLPVPKVPKLKLPGEPKPKLATRKAV